MDQERKKAERNSKGKGKRGLQNLQRSINYGWPIESKKDAL